MSLEMQSHAIDAIRSAVEGVFDDAEEIESDLKPSGEEINGVVVVPKSYKFKVMPASDRYNAVWDRLRTEQPDLAKHVGPFALIDEQEGHRLRIGRFA